MHKRSYHYKRILKLIDNIKNELFNVVSIIFNYILNMNSKACATLNHKVLDYLCLLLIRRGIAITVGDFIGTLRQKVLYSTIVIFG